MCQRDSGFDLSRAAVCGHGPALRECLLCQAGVGGRAFQPVPLHVGREELSSHNSGLVMIS